MLSCICACDHVCSWWDELLKQLSTGNVAKTAQNTSVTIWQMDWPTYNKLQIQVTFDGRYFAFDIEQPNPPPWKKCYQIFPSNDLIPTSQVLKNPCSYADPFCVFLFFFLVKNVSSNVCKTPNLSLFSELRPAFHMVTLYWKLRIVSLSNY